MQTFRWLITFALIAFAVLASCAPGQPARYNGAAVRESKLIRIAPRPGLGHRELISMKAQALSEKRASGVKMQSTELTNGAAILAKLG